MINRKMVNMVVVQTAAGFSTGKIDEDIGTVPEHNGTSCGAFKYGVGGEPLAEGAGLTTARQILLDLKGWRLAPFVLQLQ